MTTLEQAVASALPEGKEAYFFLPILLWHVNGKCYGVFGGANQANAWWKGASAEDRRYFYLTNERGARVTIKDNPAHPGHASAILDTLDRHSREAK